MFYRSEFYPMDGTAQVCRSQISDEQYQEIKRMTQVLIASMHEMDYFIIVADNIEDFLNDCRINGIEIEKNFARANRYLLNWLSSFYAWIEYHEKNFKTLFTDLKKKYYDRSFSYRLAYNLRKYMTHHSLAITEISFDGINEKQSIHIIPANILETENGALQAGVRRELQKMMANNEHIDAVDLTKSFIKVFKSFQKDIWRSQEEEISTALNYLLQFVPLTPPDCYNCAIIASDHTYFPIGRTLENYTRKSQCISSYLD